MSKLMKTGQRLISPCKPETLQLDLILHSFGSLNMSRSRSCQFIFIFLYLKCYFSSSFSFSSLFSVFLFVSRKYDLKQKPCEFQLLLRRVFQRSNKSVFIHVNTWLSYTSFKVLRSSAKEYVAFHTVKIIMNFCKKSLTICVLSVRSYPGVTLIELNQLSECFLDHIRSLQITSV